MVSGSQENGGKTTREPGTQWEKSREQGARRMGVRQPGSREQGGKSLGSREPGEWG